MLISWTAMYTINYSHTSSLHVLCNPMPDVSIGAMMCYAVRCHVFTLSRVLMSDSSTRSLTLPWRCLEVLTEPADFGVLSVSDLLVGERGSKRLPALSLWVFDRNVQSMQNSMEWVFPCSIPQSRHCADMHIWVWIEIRSSFLRSCGFRTCHSDCSCMCAFREFSLKQYLKSPSQNILLSRGRKKHLVRLRCSN